MMGSSIKAIQLEEKEMRLVSRKSITLKKSIKEGNIIKESDLTLKRPGTGLMSGDIKNLVGKAVNRDLLIDYQIKFDDLE